MAPINIDWEEVLVDHGRNDGADVSFASTPSPPPRTRARAARGKQKEDTPVRRRPQTRFGVPQRDTGPGERDRRRRALLEPLAGVHESPEVCLPISPPRPCGRFRLDVSVLVCFDCGRVCGFRCVAFVSLGFQLCIVCFCSPIFGSHCGAIQLCIVRFLCRLHLKSGAFLLTLRTTCFNLVRFQHFNFVVTRLISEFVGGNACYLFGCRNQNKMPLNLLPCNLLFHLTFQLSIT
jgi:hypothetical protein